MAFIERARHVHGGLRLGGLLVTPAGIRIVCRETTSR
jgi:hypothetical protein